MAHRIIPSFAFAVDVHVVVLFVGVLGMLGFEVVVRGGCIHNRPALVVLFSSLCLLCVRCG